MFCDTRNRYRAILVTSPEAPGIDEEFVSMLRRFSLGAPIFALYAGENGPENAVFSNFYDKVYPESEISYDLISDIIKYQGSRGMKTVGNYKVIGLDVSVFTSTPAFFDVPVSLTKTEIMIIRLLTVTYPTPVKAADILKFAFKSAKCPEISNIRTHVSSINKKLSPMLERPFISSESRIGYKVTTPPALEDILDMKRAAATVD